MKEVSKLKFFSVIGIGDVIPSVDVASLKLSSKEVKSIFKTRAGDVVGMTVGSPPNTKFFLIERLAS